MLFRSGVEVVHALHKLLCDGIQPDLTLLMDSEVSASVARARRRNTAASGPHDENRFEQESRAFFERVRNAYLAIAKREPERVVLLDARQPIETVHREIVEAVRARLLKTAKTA